MATVSAAAAPSAGADRRWLIVRLGLVQLGVLQGATALWALLAPRSFFDDFPISAAHWVRALPPYNEHLVRDYGSSFTAIAALALIAAWLADARLVRVALVVWAIAALPHLAFHLAHPDDPSGVSGALSLTTLALNAAAPLLLLAIAPKENRR